MGLLRPLQILSRPMSSLPVSTPVSVPLGQPKVTLGGATSCADTFGIYLISYFVFSLKAVQSTCFIYFILHQIGWSRHLTTPGTVYTLGVSAKLLISNFPIIIVELSVVWTAQTCFSEEKYASDLPDIFLFIFQHILSFFHCAFKGGIKLFIVRHS